jgi:DNA helicase-2/ATP-dependent DNA helicase PcrA
VPAAAREEFDAFRRAIADCLGMEAPGGAEGEAGATEGKASGTAPALSAQVERIRRFYEPIFQRTYDYPHLRLRDLDQLQQIAEGYTARGQFLTDLTLDPPASTQDLAGPPLLDEDFLILSTIHSAKGLEWDSVHILHVADGMIPSDMSTGSETEIEEERRLLYVAMTRAQNALHLYFPLRYYDRPRSFGDRHGYAQLTRFLPDAILPLFDRTGAGPKSAETDSAADTPAGTPQAIDAMLRGLWSE